MRSHLRQPGYSALTQHSRLAEDWQWALSHCSPLPSKLKHSFFTSVPQQTTNCPQSETEISAKPMFSAVSSVKIWPCFVGTLCTSLATLQLWDMKLPWELLWTSGYSGWSLSEKISTSCRRLFHLNSPQVFKACKLFISIFLFSHKTVARKKSLICLQRGKPCQDNSKISTFDREHRADDALVELYMQHPKLQIWQMKMMSLLLEKGNLSLQGQKNKKAFVPLHEKLEALLLRKPAATSYQKADWCPRSLSFSFLIITGFQRLTVWTTDGI